MTATTTAVPPSDESLEAPQQPGKRVTSLLGAAPSAPGPARRLSESPLWDRQRRFYDRGATEIWGSGAVPHGITCNPRIANTYARIVLEFLQRAGPSSDAGGESASGSTDVPHIVEFGGGTGRFAYLFVRQLRELAPGLCFTYVVTDFAADRVAAWASHPSYRPLIDEGLIDFAVLDADHPGPLELAVSGRTLRPGGLDGPVIGIANYVFDTLRHDCYAINGDALAEVHVSICEDTPIVAQPGSGPEPAIEWESAPIGPVPGHIAAVLEQYREILDDTAVLVPVGGMRCLDYLDELTTGPAFALVADKGHAVPLELCSQQAPSLVYHGSAFSVMVNFDLLARWVRGRGGVGILPTEPARSLVVGAFALGSVEAPDRLAAYVRDQLLDVGPDNYYSVRPLLGSAATQTLDPMLACIRLSRFDPSVVIELLPGLLGVLPTVSESTRTEVERLLAQVWDSYFPIGEPIDMALCVGLLLSAIQRFPEAAEMLKLSVGEHPDSAPAAFSMAVAQRGMRDLRAARDWVNRALELDPVFAEARTLRAVLADDLAGAGG